ncbi:MAG: methyltransferase domain-containing protein [Anaerolineae bacterium]|nr:methyltransferase domain-containing protein [Anaerolineae bacterium]
MKPHLLDVLACPACASDLQLSISPAAPVDGSSLPPPPAPLHSHGEGSRSRAVPPLYEVERGSGGEANSVTDKIITGELLCNGCGRTYPITDGIPRLLSQTTQSASVTNTYGSFFTRRRSNFLAPGANFPLSQAIIKGFEPADYESGWCLEIGAGLGRLSTLLASHFLGKDAQLVCLEPSAGIDLARRNLAEYPNIHWVQGDATHLPFKRTAFRTVVLQGVLPHIPADHVQLLHAAADILVPGGTVQINSSWYPFPGLERRFQQIRRLVAVFPALLIPLVSALFATISPLTFKRIGNMQPFIGFLHTFVYSPQQKWRLRYTQYEEILGTPVYEIFKSYDDICRELLAAGFGDLRLYSHAVSVKGTKGGDPRNPVEALGASLKKSRVIILGTGYMAHLTERVLKAQGIDIQGWATWESSAQRTIDGKPIFHANQLPDLHQQGCFDWLVVATDYYLQPYDTIIRQLDDMGLRWNTHVTTFQVVMSMFNKQGA